MRKKHPLPLLFFLPFATAIVVFCQSVTGFQAQQRVFCHDSRRSLRVTSLPAGRRLTAIGLSRKKNNDDDDDRNGPNFFVRRVEKADLIEIRNDATLCACYVLCRFFFYDLQSGAKVAPGWEIQDLIWLTGTCSSAVVLIVYYVVAGLLSRAYESNTAFSRLGLSPATKALVNVVLCCPVWLVTEHMLNFGPPGIGGGGPAITIATGLFGLGSFMVLAKTLTAGVP